jgi:phage tail-like protein
MRRRSDWLLAQLPMGMLDDDLFVRFVSIFQEVATSLLENADNVPNVVDPTVAPVPALSWLASWLGVTWIEPSLPEELQRRVVRECGRALAWRGTRRGLEILLEAVTGGEVEVEESGGVRRGTEPPTPAPDPRVRVAVRTTGWMSDDDFVELVTDEVPANVRCEIVVDGREIWPRPGGAPGTKRADA